MLSAEAGTALHYPQFPAFPSQPQNSCKLGCCPQGNTTHFRAILSGPCSCVKREVLELPRHYFSKADLRGLQDYYWTLAYLEGLLFFSGPSGSQAGGPLPKLAGPAPQRGKVGRAPPLPPRLCTPPRRPARQGLRLLRGGTAARAAAQLSPLQRRPPAWTLAACG